MKKVLVLMFLLAMSTFMYAQSNKSLVTPQMAYKLSYHLQKHPPIITKLFCDANNINPYELRSMDGAIAAINQKPQYAENFFVKLFNYYGTGDYGYLVFKEFGFTPQEYDIALKIYNNNPKVKEARERREKAIKDDEDTYTKWQTEGAPNLPSDKVAKNAVVSCTNPDVFDKLIEDNFKPFDLQGNSDVICSLKCKVIISKDKTITIPETEDLSTKTLFEQAGLRVDEVAKYEFENIDKKVDVGQEANMSIVLRGITSDRQANLISLVKYDKKMGHWTINRKEPTYIFDNLVTKKRKIKENEKYSPASVKIAVGISDDIENLLAAELNKMLEPDKNQYWVQYSFFSLNLEILLDGKQVSRLPLKDFKKCGIITYVPKGKINFVD
ncbi:MAG: hypothetical protein IKX65_00050 [Prevotella sp.]|nr:hypothetical protein [Prevotella sp.]